MVSRSDEVLTESALEFVEIGQYLTVFTAGDLAN
jgi:hypothetical protein